MSGIHFSLLMATVTHSLLQRLAEYLLAHNVKHTGTHIHKHMCTQMHMCKYICTCLQAHACI